MSEHRRPTVTYPCRVPMKVIGKAGELKPEAIAALVYRHLHGSSLAVEWALELDYRERLNGAWVSHTYWIILPDEHAERPLREAIQKLPGVVMQL